MSIELFFWHTMFNIRLQNQEIKHKKPLKYSEKPEWSVSSAFAAGLLH